VVEKIRADGGEIYAITSEPQRLADNARHEWELDFETIGDPHHEISSQCQDKGWLELIVNTQSEMIEAEDAKFAHPKGYFQPGVLCLDANQHILYRWRSIPTFKNIGGAVERPTANYVYNQITKALEQPDKTSDAKLDTQPELDSQGRPFPVFISLLIANGWFVKPKTFLFVSGGTSAQQRIKNAAIRIPFFIAAWIFALVILPSSWVGLAAVTYGIWLTPHIRLIVQHFQNVNEPES
jgi:hypothetical protein